MENIPFQVPIIDAIFYEHCIEDSEKKIELEYEFANSCTNDNGNAEHALIYNKNYGDVLYVLQNGSLLRVDEDFSSYDVYDDYCLDMDRDDLLLTAVICKQTKVIKVSRAEAYLYATCKLCEFFV